MKKNNNKKKDMLKWRIVKNFLKKVKSVSCVFKKATCVNDQR